MFIIVIQKRKDPATLPGNVNKTANIRDLREEWKCTKPNGTCVGTHCYVNPGTGAHFPLNPAMFDCWASAMVCHFLSFSSICSKPRKQLKSDGSATLHKPPNHKLFDTKTTVSPVLQRRMTAQNNASATNTAPFVNLSLADVASLLNPQVQAPLAGAPHNPPSDSLLHPGQLPGPDAPLADFCTQYNLSDDILNKFTKNAYTHARMLRFVKITDLEKMGFLLGEIAGLRDAVEQWSG